MKTAKRTSWAYCPRCCRDLNGDNDSFIRDEDGRVYYTCATCTFHSYWDFTAPAPIYIGEWWADGMEWPSCWDKHPSHEECPHCSKAT